MLNYCKHSFERACSLGDFFAAVQCVLPHLRGYVYKCRGADIVHISLLQITNAQTLTVFTLLVVTVNYTAYCDSRHFIHVAIAELCQLIEPAEMSRDIYFVRAVKFCAYSQWSLVWFLVEAVFHISKCRNFVHVFIYVTLCMVAPRKGASSGCGRRKRFPDVEGSCEYIE